jgi:hypothetical protein
LSGQKGVKLIKRKYNNIKKTVNGIKFDSIKEANRYQELMLLQKAKKIMNLKLQPEFILQDSFKIGKVIHRAIKYIADFQYAITENDRFIVEDVKGMKTEVYRIKKKLLLYKFPEINFIES